MRDGVAAALGAGLTVGAILLLSWVDVVEIDFDADDPVPKVSDSAYLNADERAPREFLYLDSARAEAYLSQLQGGNETLRKTSEKTTRKASGEVGVGGVKIGGEAAREGSVERTVSPTTASNFLELTLALHNLSGFRKLASPDATVPDDITLRRSGVTISRVRSQASADAEGNTDFRAAWEDVEEGDIVHFIASIRRPTFLRVYQTLRQVPASSELGSQGAAVLEEIGEPPRLPLAVEAPLPRRTSGGPAQPRVLRLVLPTLAANLTAEPSLFAPRLTVVGKVVRRLDGNRAHYRDLVFASRFAPVLKLPEATLTRLNAPLARLKAELKRYRNITAPAAVIIPIAIYK